MRVKVIAMAFLPLSELANINFRSKVSGLTARSAIVQLRCYPSPGGRAQDVAALSAGAQKHGEWPAPMMAYLRFFAIAHAATPQVAEDNFCFRLSQGRVFLGRLAAGKRADAVSARYDGTGCVRA